MTKQTGIISMQDAIKAATKTVVNSQNEVEDVYVGTKSGKVRQVIEHPGEMWPSSAVER